MSALDPVAQGRVQILECPADDAVQAKLAIDELVRLSRLDPEWSWSRTAIIAREWRRLAPVRAYAETLGIPVELANESLPSIWRLREVQQFIDAVRKDPTRLLTIHDLVVMKNAIPTNRWTDLIAEGIAALAHELNTKPIPVPDLVEWFAEWARDARSEQRALLLLTAHRAKGLEFDDVVILDGGWDRLSKGEDADAPRRLFYVAMTRARRSLAIIAGRQHPFVPSGNQQVLRRPAPAVVEGVNATTLIQNATAHCPRQELDAQPEGRDLEDVARLDRLEHRRVIGPEHHRASSAGCTPRSPRLTRSDPILKMPAVTAITAKRRHDGRLNAHGNPRRPSHPAHAADRAGA
jgi:ATP-dependent DNA helicase RecQ